MSKKKIIAISMIIVGVLLIAGFSIYSVFRRREPTAGLKINTTPSSLVFVNNVEAGQTPIDKLFVPGEATVKLIPNSTSSALSTYQTKVNLNEKTYTIINRNFGDSDTSSSGEIISLQSQSEPTPSLSVITSSPDTASVLVDGQPQGFTPLSLASISAGTHQITITAPGYTTSTVSAQTVTNYKLILTVKLATSTTTVITSTPTPVIIATPSATLVPTPLITSKPLPTPTLAPSPRPTSVPTPTAIVLPRPYVTILDTPTGFLRVRSLPSLGGIEIGQVDPGKSYPLLDSSTGWYLIKAQLEATASGWISSQFAKKFE